MWICDGYVTDMRGSKYKCFKTNPKTTHNINFQNHLIVNSRGEI